MPLAIGAVFFWENFEKHGFFRVKGRKMAEKNQNLPKYSALSPKHQVFIDEYIKTHNLARSAEAAGSRAKNLSQAGKDLLKNSDIAEALEERRFEVAKSLHVTVQSVISGMAANAFSMIGNYLDGNRIVDIKELPAEIQAAVASIKTTVRYEGRGEDASEVVTTELKLWDKPGSLRDLGKHLGLFEADNRQKPLVIVKDFTGEYDPDPEDDDGGDGDDA